MKDRVKKIGRFLAGITAFGVLVGSMTFLTAGEPGGTVTVMEPEQEYADGTGMDLSAIAGMGSGGDMAAMMEQYQQMMGGSDADISAMMGMMSGSGDMSAMMQQYQQMMGSGGDMSAMAGMMGGSDMSAMLEQFMGGEADGPMADLIAQYAGGDLSSLLGGSTEEQEPVEWVTVNIRDEKDWEEFVRNCQLDTWSKDKKVQLKTDLTLESGSTVPTFGGIFDGEGHTIDGLELDTAGSYRGLFRHIQAGAEVKDLNVSGTVRVSGGWEAAGGIAGENLGTIARCTFDGTVEGSSGVGGIAGINGITGQIVGCSVSGEVSGEHGTGGITGENSGSLIRCISTAGVNTGVETVTPELDNVKLEDITASENFAACTDTGGIAGYSSGFIQHCISRGDIGYPHTGYNVGGIVGRQTGYIVNCTNHGTVSGRKEVGGIVGQMEPFTQPVFEQSALMDMAAALSGLQGKLDNILAGLDNSNQKLSGHMTGLNDLTGDAQDSIDNMLEDVYDLGGGMIDTVNDLSARLALVIEMAVPMIEDYEKAFASLADVIDIAEDAIAELEEAADPAEDLMDEIYDAMGDISDSSGEAEDAVADLKTALQYLLGAIGTDEETSAALDQAEAALQGLGASLKDTMESIGVLADAFAALQEDDLPGWDTDALAEELKAVEDAVGQNHQAAWLFVEGLKALEKAIFAEPGDDLADLKDAWTNFGEAVKHLISGGKELAGSFDHIREMIPILEDLGEEVLDSSEVFRESMDSLADMTGYISDSMGELAKIFEAQSRYPALELPKLTDNFLKDSENLSHTVDSMLAEMQAMQLSMTDMADDLIDGVRDLVNSFDDLAVSLVSSMAGSGGELVKDVSEEESGGLFGIAMGTVSGCTNLGAVDGDTNTGGITGSMAVEFSIDPELEMSFESMPMVSVSFQTRAVLRDSLNRGSVTGRKDCTGGVVGRAGLGLVTGCTAVSDVSGANYVGGVAGMAETPVRNSWAKGLLSGTGYLGGIAGSASELTDCRAQAQLKEIVAFSGAVAGEAKTLSGNYYVGDEIGAVDGISYSGKAEPIGMDGFLLLENVPEAMRVMTVTFVFADGSVETVTVEPGEKLSDEDIPDLPGKEGYAGYWDGLEELGAVEHDTVIRAVYLPKGSTVQSEQTRDGRPILLVQGGADAPRVEMKESSACPELGEKDTFVEGWSFTIPKGSKETTVRYLLPRQDGGTLRLMVRSGGEWTEADYRVDGSYAVFNVKSGENELACIRTENMLWLWLAIAGGGTVIVVVAAVLLLKKKRF